jgi:hypothetical protein
MNKPEDNILLRLPPHLGQLIRRIAQQERRSINSTIIIAIEDYITNHTSRLHS